MATNFSDFFFPGVQNAFTAFTPIPEEFAVTDPASFREQAEREASSFFDKDLSLAMKEIETARTQARASKELVEKQEGEDFGDFKSIQDRNFARTLAAQQSGFAGRGTFTSGVRRGAIEEARQTQEDVLNAANREKRQAGEGRELDFTQFLERSGQTEERTKLGIERQKQEEITRRQLQLADIAEARTQSALNIRERTFDEAFGSSFAKFLGQKAGA